MKRIGILLALCFAIQLCLAQNNPFNAKDSILITGKIIGYKTSQQDHFITFSAHDLFGRSTASAIQIGDDGKFWIKLYQAYAGDIQFNYRDEYIPVFVKPASTLDITIDDSKINTSKSSEGAFIASGELAEINNLIFKFRTEFDQHSFKLQTNLGDKTQSDSVFAARSIAKLNEQLAFLDSFIAKNKVTNQTFINWQRSNFQYDTGRDVLFFPFAGKFNKEITQKQLLKLIGPIPINNPSAFNNSMYYGFLSMITSSHQIIFNINPIYSEVKKDQNGSTVALCLDEIDRYASGLTKEILYYMNFNSKASNLSDPNVFWSRFETVITNPYLKAQLSNRKNPLTHSFKTFSVIDRLNTQKITPVLKQKLIALFDQYNGTNLYIDFWGDWCGPCMQEMPTYPKVITAFAGKSVKFLFLSTFTTVESMKAIKEKYKINGDFINLSKDEVAVLNNVFGFHSYPSHFMVNAEGKTIGQLSKGDHMQKVKEIEQLLAK